MNATEAGLLGVQLTLVGLFLAVFFAGVAPYPMVGVLFGIGGTAVVLTAVFAETWR